MTTLQCFSRMVKLGYPSCEIMLSVVECPLCDTQAERDHKIQVSHLLCHDSGQNDLV
jgi:hypothetical protein